VIAPPELFVAIDQHTRAAPALTAKVVLAAGASVIVAG